jgi:hypothetical protein
MANQKSAIVDRRADRRMLAALLALALLTLALPGRAEAATGDPVLLNEALVSHTGTDTTEYLELFGIPGTPLTGMSLVAVEGDGALAGTIDRRVDFPAGAHLGGNGFYLVGNPTGLASNYHAVPDLAWGDDALENGSQTLALVTTAGLGGVGTMVTGSETVHDAVGLTDGGASDRWFWTAPVVGPDDGFLPGGVRRFTDGLDTDTIADWVFADDQLGPHNTPTPASPYNAPPTADCGPSLTTDEGTAVAASVTAIDRDGRMTTFGAASTPDPGTVALGTVVAAPAAGQPATAQVEVTARTPPGSYVVTVTATNDDPTPQSAECSLSVTVNDLPDPAPTLDTAGLWAVVNDLMTTGGMADGKAHLLTDRLQRIDRLMAGGQDAAAAAQLRALANQAMGLSPRWLGSEAASALADEADALRAALAA